MTLARIYLADKESGKWLPLMAAPQDSENVIQLALAKSPELIPGDQIDPGNPCRWLLVESELGDPETGARPSLVFVDQNAIPTFVVCEEYATGNDHSGTVATMISLATQATIAWSGEKLHQAAGETANKQGSTLEEQLLLLLGGEPDQEAFWAAVDDNLGLRRLRLIFVGGTISNDLWQMLQFLDGTMRDVQVLALEMKQYRAGGQKALLPRLIGHVDPVSKGTNGSKSNGSLAATLSPGLIQKEKPAKPQSKPAQAPEKLAKPAVESGDSKPLPDTRFSEENNNSWDEDSFFSDLTGRSEEAQVLVAKQIFNWAKKNTTEMEWGGGATRGVFAPVYDQGVRKCQLFIVTSNGWIELNLRAYEHHPPFNQKEKLERFFDKLKAIDQLDLPDEALEKRTLLPLSLFTAPSRLAQFLKVFEWAMVNMETSTGELKPIVNEIPNGKLAALWPAPDDQANPQGNADRYGSYESSFDELLNRKRVELDDDDSGNVA